MYDDDEITPTRVFLGLGRWAWLGVIGFLVIAGIVVGGWQASWWFSSQNATKNYQVTQNGVSNQDTLRTNIQTGFNTLLHEEVEVGANRTNTSLAESIQVEAASEATTLCGWANQVTGVPLPPQQATWAAQNCTDGALSPSSSYYVKGAP
jgi:hypothetical protein